MKEPEKHGLPSITCRALRDMKDKGRPHRIIDVRDLSEYEAGHVEDSVHVPHNELETNIESLVPEKAHVIVVIIGEEPDHAREVHAHLVGRGYKDVRFLLGGFDEWCKPAEPDISDYVELTAEEEEKDVAEEGDRSGDIDEEDEKYEPLY